MSSGVFADWTAFFQATLKGGDLGLTGPRTLRAISTSLLHLDIVWVLWLEADLLGYPWGNAVVIVVSGGGVRNVVFETVIRHVRGELVGLRFPWFFLLDAQQLVQLFLQLSNILAQFLPVLNISGTPLNLFLLLDAVGGQDVIPVVRDDLRRVRPQLTNSKWLNNCRCTCRTNLWTSAI